MIILYLALLVIFLGVIWVLYSMYPEYEFALIVLAFVLFCHGILVGFHIRA